MFCFFVVVLMFEVVFYFGWEFFAYVRFRKASNRVSYVRFVEFMVV